MMRSLFSGVAGLKVHQTKMDVIGNNIANVNTVGFKSSSVNFADQFYQTISSASGPNANTGTAGVNAKQIGLGSNLASITVNITGAGGTQVTDRALDLAIVGDAFLVVQSNGMTYFTRSGALNVDENGTLYCTTNGATVMGWSADDNGEILKDTVKPLQVMSADKLYIEPTATRNVTMQGNIDQKDPQVANTGEGDDFTTGLPMTFSFFDNLGQEYLVKMIVQQDPDNPNNYAVKLADIFDSDGNSIFVKKELQDDGTEKYVSTGVKVKFGENEFGIDEDSLDEIDGTFTMTGKSTALLFDGDTGNFLGIGAAGTDTLSFTVTPPDAWGYNPFPKESTVNGVTKGGIEIDFSALTGYADEGVSNTTPKKGDAKGYGAGNAAGRMNGIAIQQDGKIYGVYDNGETKCLGQIAVATFANPSGLEAVGNSLFAASLNSGEFDGIGVDIMTVGKFSVGALEMSNVDLAGEFTQMITTQRGFQANSRIITTSDTMLEELINLKR